MVKFKAILENRLGQKNALVIDQIYLNETHFDLAAAPFY